MSILLKARVCLYALGGVFFGGMGFNHNQLMQWVWVGFLIG